MKNISQNIFIITLVFFIIITSSKKGSYLDTVSYNIIPQFPSEAFLGQYYTCRFRVNGMQNPIFKFYNLPKFFKASPKGVIQGIPDKIGTYEIYVTYEEIYQYDEKSILLRVVPPIYSEQVINTKNNKTKLVELINYDMNYVYRVYEDVLINLNQFKTNKYYWTYLNLPQTLQATQDGIITGIINKQGYYPFGAICTDQNGYTKDYFFNLNIQPFVFTGYRKSPTFADLFVQNTLIYNPLSVLAIYNQAANNLLRVFNNANQVANKVRNLKTLFLDTKLKVKDAEGLLAKQQLIVDAAIIQKAAKSLIQKAAQQNLLKHQNIFKLAQTAFNQALNKTRQVQIQLNNSIANFNRTRKILDDSSNQAVKAKNQLRAALSQVQKIQRQIKSIQQDIQIYIQDISTAKKAVQNAKGKKLLVDSEVHQAKNKRDIALGANDQATAKYNTARDALEKEKNRLNQTTKNVTIARFDKNRAQGQLGKAKFNLNQALNQLYIAQAAKQQSDKAMLLASTQASVMPSGQTTYIFAGCDNQNYPTISGTAQIIKNLDLKGGCYSLSSGFSIIPGNCDNKIILPNQFKQGDSIRFQGYIKDGRIHGIKISK